MTAQLAEQAPAPARSRQNETDPEARAEAGRSARIFTPRTLHGEWTPAPDRGDPIAILEAQGVTRVQELLPVRYGRMLASPFAFYRGAAAVMAADLAPTPTTGLVVQACGDAHLANFGIFASPEREMVFDVNDFDETLPGPWEWDVKRLAASLAIASRYRRLSDLQRHELVAGAVRSYRMTIRGFADMGHLAVWYSRLDVSALDQWLVRLKKKQITRTQAATAKARAKNSLSALSKLTAERDGRLRFLSMPPLLVPLSELTGGDDMIEQLTEMLALYAESLRPELRHLLNRYRLVDMARKVVGVGSVGTRAWVALLAGRNGEDPLILQAKEAEASVLERYVGESEFGNHGQRVVVGQRITQSASDIFLGWVHVTGLDGVERDFYLRQLWDGKGSADLDTILPSGLQVYAELCGWTLARAHARSGDAIAIGSYLGSGPTFDRALVRFADAYADQNEKDHAALAAAVAEGRLTAQVLDGE
jgi:uncharacterized protein (DUF2252 family)